MEEDTIKAVISYGGSQYTVNSDILVKVDAPAQEYRVPWPTIICWEEGSEGARKYKPFQISI